MIMANSNNENDNGINNSQWKPMIMTIMWSENDQ